MLTFPISDTEKSILLSGEMQQVPRCQVWENIIIEQSQWFVVGESQAQKALTFVFENESHQTGQVC